MEVWVLEVFYTDTGDSVIFQVFENADVGMNLVNISFPNIIWTNKINYWSSNKVNGKIYYLSKFEVILDEMPTVKN
jgi:hypothetical protein